jgi:hypothetical protein
VTESSSSVFPGPVSKTPKERKRIAKRHRAVNLAATDLRSAVRVIFDEGDDKVVYMSRGMRLQTVDMKEFSWAMDFLQTVLPIRYRISDTLLTSALLSSARQVMSLSDFLLRRSRLWKILLTPVAPDLAEPAGAANFVEVETVALVMRTLDWVHRTGDVALLDSPMEALSVGVMSDGRAGCVIPTLPRCARKTVQGSDDDDVRTDPIRLTFSRACFHEWKEYSVTSIGADDLLNHRDALYAFDRLCLQEALFGLSKNVYLVSEREPPGDQHAVRRMSFEDAGGTRSVYVWRLESLDVRATEHDVQTLLRWNMVPERAVRRAQSSLPWAARHLDCLSVDARRDMQTALLDLNAFMTD